MAFEFGGFGGFSFDEDDDSSDSDDDLSLEQMRERRRGPGVDVPTGRKKRKTETKKRKYQYEYDFPGRDMRKCRHDPTRSQWWHLLRHPDTPNERSKMGIKFRRKFRVPHAMFQMIVQEAQKKPEWTDKPIGVPHGRGPPRHPLAMKVLCALRHWAKGDDSDSLEDQAHMSAACIGAFLRQFTPWFDSTFFAHLVKRPSPEELNEAMEVYKKLGFPGCYAETDGVHIPWDSCPAVMTGRFKGKEGYPTVAFNVSVLHSRKIIEVPEYCAGAVNDQTQAKYDTLFQDLRANKIHPEKVYYLYDANGNLKPFKGLYLIVDGGYLKWRCLQAPLKHATGNWAARWSERLESVRKAVENTFGILKRRFRILRVPFTGRDPKDLEHVFHCCCILHNMLLEHDKLSTIGRDANHWVSSKTYKEREAVEDARSRATVRGPETSSVATHDPAFSVLRDALITHFEQASLKGELGWLRTAADLRAAGALDRDEEDDDDADQFEEGLSEREEEEEEEDW